MYPSLPICLFLSLYVLPLLFLSPYLSISLSLAYKQSPQWSSNLPCIPPRDCNVEPSFILQKTYISIRIGAHCTWGEDQTFSSGCWLCTGPMLFYRVWLRLQMLDLAGHRSICQPMIIRDLFGFTAVITSLSLWLPACRDYPYQVRTDHYDVLFVALKAIHCFYELDPAF